MYIPKVVCVTITTSFKHFQPPMCPPPAPGSRQSPSCLHGFAPQDKSHEGNHTGCGPLILAPITEHRDCFESRGHGYVCQDLAPFSPRVVAPATHPPAGGCWGRFHLWAAVRNATAHVGAHRTCGQTDTCFPLRRANTREGSYQALSFLRNCQTGFQRGHTYPVAFPAAQGSRSPTTTGTVQVLQARGQSDH